MSTRELQKRIANADREDVAIGISFISLTLVMMIVAMLDLDPTLASTPATTVGDFFGSIGTP